MYITFKAYTNFVDIVPQKSRLRLSLNISFSDILDPKGLCKDVSGVGRWGNGDVEVGISNLNEIDDIMSLIQQAFDKQMEENKSLSKEGCKITVSRINSHLNHWLRIGLRQGRECISTPNERKIRTI